MSNNLDFDYLSNLYKTDPKKFEEVRAQEIDKVIQSASPKIQKRLTGLQFQIDAKREIHKDSPMGSCMAISKMMHESFSTLRHHLNDFTGKQDPLGQRPLQQKESESTETNCAKVIQFRA